MQFTTQILEPITENYDYHHMLRECLEHYVDDIVAKTKRL